MARHVRPGIDPEKAAKTSRRLALLARSALTGKAFLASFGFASGDLLFDLLSLDLVFLALRYQPGFGPLAVAYAAANIASAIPVTPGGLGVIEVTLVAITVGFGAPRPRRCWQCSATRQAPAITGLFRVGPDGRAGVRVAGTGSSARTGEVLAAVMTLAAVALALLAVLRLTLGILGRRRLAAWETAWSAVGPQWSRRKS